MRRPDVCRDRSGVLRFVVVWAFAESDRERLKRSNVSRGVARHGTRVEPPTQMATHRDIAASLHPHSVVYGPSQPRQQGGLAPQLLIVVRPVPGPAKLYLPV